MIEETGEVQGGLSGGVEVEMELDAETQIERLFGFRSSSTRSTRTDCMTKRFGQTIDLRLGMPELG